LLSGLVDNGGDLVLSGVLDRQLEELRAAYAPWIALEPSAHDEGWVLLAGKRRAGSHMA
jgi:ribosomal protein L11 methyltransferase